jgi:hypothetical protein
VLFPWRAITWAFRWNEVNEISGERGSGSEADFADILPHRIVVHFHDCWMIFPRRVVRRRQMVISSLTCGSWTNNRSICRRNSYSLKNEPITDYCIVNQQKVNSCLMSNTIDPCKDWNNLTH